MFFSSFFFLDITFFSEFFHKLRLQLGWVGSQQNANQCKLRVCRSLWKCLRLQKILLFLICMPDILRNFQKSLYFLLSTFEFLCPLIAQNLLDHIIVDLHQGDSKIEFVQKFWKKISDFAFCHFAPLFFGGGGVGTWNANVIT